MYDSDTIRIERYESIHRVWIMSRLTQFARRSKMARSARLSLVLVIRRSELEDKRIATGTRVMCCKAWARALNWSDALNPPADLRRIALETPRLRFVFSAKNKTFKDEIIGCRPLRRQKKSRGGAFLGGFRRWVPLGSSRLPQKMRARASIHALRLLSKTDYAPFNDQRRIFRVLDLSTSSGV